MIGTYQQVGLLSHCTAQEHIIFAWKQYKLTYAALKGLGADVSKVTVLA